MKQIHFSGVSNILSTLILQQKSINTNWCLYSASQHEWLWVHCRGCSTDTYLFFVTVSLCFILLNKILFDTWRSEKFDVYLLNTLLNGEIVTVFLKMCLFSVYQFSDVERVLPVCQ